jgi:predicted nucleotidyltransferase
MGDYRNTEDVYDIEEIKRRLTPVFRRYGVRKAVLFGSYARGEARPVSDVDLLVDTGLIGLDFVGFSGRVMDALEKDADVIDVSHVITNSRIAHEIRRTGVMIYG